MSNSDDEYIDENTGSGKETAAQIAKTPALPHIYQIHTALIEENSNENTEQRKPLKIIQIACAGEASKDQQQVANEIANRVVELDKEGYDVLITYGGDGFYNKGPSDGKKYHGVNAPNDNKFNTHFYDIYNVVCEKAKKIIPFFFVPGNHEYGITSTSTEIEFPKVTHLIDHSNSKYIENKIELRPDDNGIHQLQLNDLPMFNMPHNYYALITEQHVIVMLDTNRLVDEYLDRNQNNQDHNNNQALWFIELLTSDLLTNRQLLVVGHHPIASDGKQRGKGIISNVPAIADKITDDPSKSELIHYLHADDKKGKTDRAKKAYVQFQSLEYNDVCAKVINECFYTAFNKKLSATLSSPNTKNNHFPNGMQIKQYLQYQQELSYQATKKDTTAPDAIGKTLDRIMSTFAGMYLTGHNHFAQIKKTNSPFLKLQLQISSGGKLQKQVGYDAPSITVEKCGFFELTFLGKRQEITMHCIDGSPVTFSPTMRSLIPDLTELDSPHDFALAQAILYCHEQQLNASNGKIRAYSEIAVVLQRTFENPDNDISQIKKQLDVLAKDNTKSTIVMEIKNIFSKYTQSYQTISSILNNSPSSRTQKTSPSESKSIELTELTENLPPEDEEYESDEDSDSGNTLRN